MATSNRDRVGRMFELLAPPLDEFISRSVASKLNKGASWTVLMQLKDEQKPEFDSSVSAWACSSTSLQGFCAVREYPPCA